MANKMNFPTIAEIKGQSVSTDIPADDVLNQVVTIAGAAELTGAKKSAVRRAVARKSIPSVKSGGISLIRKADAIRMWASKGAVRGTICLLIPTIATALLAIAAY